jgi:predicted amidohydrolase
MAKKVRIGLVQMHCEKGAVAENLEKTARCLEEATARDVDIVGFPEASITGYVNPDRYPDTVLQLDGPEIVQVVEITRGHSLTVLAGLVEENPAGKPFITQIVVRDGQLLGHYRKKRNVEEDAEWYAVGDMVPPVFTHDDLTFGISICADMGDEEVFAACARQGAQIVFELAAPGLYGEQATRNWRSGFEWWEGECQKYLERYTQTHGIWAAVATQAGRTVDEDFPGGGYIFAPDGQRSYATPDWSAGAVYLELEMDTRRIRVLQ